MKNHQSKHRNKSSNKCNESDDNRTGKQSLCFHEKEHKDGIRFICKYCGQSYDLKTDLIKHVTKHRIEKPGINKKDRLHTVQQTNTNIVGKGLTRKAFKSSWKETYRWIYQNCGHRKRNCRCRS